MFDDVVYTAQDFAPASGLPWGDAFIWNNLRINGGATEVRVTNSDGSVTLFIGTGFALDGSGVPSAGSVSEVQHVSADGAVIYENYVFNASTPDLLDFYLNGISDWFLDGSDGIIGGALSNTLLGGADNDKYVVLSGSPTIVEVDGGGTDFVEVRNNVASLVLAANVENLSHAFFAGNFKGTGNALDNTMTGGVNSDTLIGLGGVDTLDGRAGIDTLIGGKGDDIYTIQDVGDKF